MARTQLARPVRRSGTVESCTTSCAIQRSGWASITSRMRAISASLACGPIITPLPAGLTGRLDHQLVQTREHVLEHLGVGEQVGLDVLQDRLLGQVEADHLGHEAVDRLVVGHAGTERVGDRHAARSVGAHQPGHAQQRVRRGTRAGRRSRRPGADRPRARARGRAWCACRARRRAPRGRTPRPARPPSAARGRHARSTPELAGPGVHTTTVASLSADGATERSALSSSCG